MSTCASPPHPHSGSWSLPKALELSYTAGDTWSATVALPAGGVFEYKYVVIDFGSKQAIAWQVRRVRGGGGG